MLIQSLFNMMPGRVVCFLLLTMLLPAAVASAAPDDVFEAYRSKGVIVAQEADMAPMSFTGPNGEAKGYIIDLWRKWSAETGVPVRFLLVDWADTISAVREGKADVHGGLFFTDQRDAFLDYTMPFFPSKGGLFVRKGAPVTGVKQLDGRRVGVIDSSFYHNYMRVHYPWMIPVPIATSEELVLAAERGDVDAFLADYPTLMYQVGIMGMSNVFKVVEFVSDQEFRAAVAEGNENMLAVVENGLKLIDQKELNAIYNRWIIGDDEGDGSWLTTAVILSLFGLLLAVLLPYVIGKFRR